MPQSKRRHSVVVPMLVLFYQEYCIFKTKKSIPKQAMKVHCFRYNIYLNKVKTKICTLRNIQIHYNYNHKFPTILLHFQNWDHWLLRCKTYGLYLQDETSGCTYNLYLKISRLLLQFVHLSVFLLEVSKTMEWQCVFCFRWLFCSNFSQVILKPRWIEYAL